MSSHLNRAFVTAAADLVITTGVGSVLLLAGRLKTTAAEAAVIMNRLEQLGIVAPSSYGSFDVLVPEQEKCDALAAVDAGRRYFPAPRPGLRDIAENLVRTCLPDGMPPDEKITLSVRVVETLVAASWRPTRP